MGFGLLPAAHLTKKTLFIIMNTWRRMLMNAVIYARYSSDRQREESIEGQLRECTEYAKKNNLTLLGTYVDRALSARTAD